MATEIYFYLTGHVAAVVCTQKLADLILDTTTIERTAHLQDAMMYMLQCAMEENCLSRSAYEVTMVTLLELSEDTASPQSFVLRY